MRLFNHTYVHLRNYFTHCARIGWGLGTEDNVLNFPSAMMYTNNVVQIRGSSYNGCRVCDFVDSKVFFSTRLLPSSCLFCCSSKNLRCREHYQLISSVMYVVYNFAFAIVIKMILRSLFSLCTRH